MSNCWIKWGFDFIVIKNKIEQLPLVDTNKLDKLYWRIDKLCKSHDKDFEIWWSYLDFLRANYIFSKDLVKQLNWTSFKWRLAVFLLAFFWTTLFGWKAFNFK